MISPVVTFVNLRTLPLIERVGSAIHERMAALANEAAELISKWYEEYHYHPELHKATEDEIAQAKQGVDEALNSLKWDDLFTPLFDYMAKVYQAGKDVPASGGYRPLDLNFLKPDPTAVDYAKRRSAELVGKRVLEDGTVIENPNPEWAITPELREDIRQTVQAALEAEPSPGDLAQDIRNIAGFQPYRSRMIARTELAFAYNSGHHDQALRMGYTKKSSLLGSLHKQPDECDQNAAVGWIPATERFPSGDMMAPYHPNCVCDLIYDREEDETDQQTAVNQSSQDVIKEMDDMATPYTPSTPGDIRVQEAASSYQPLKEVFDKSKRISTGEWDKSLKQVEVQIQEGVYTPEEVAAVKEYAGTNEAVKINRALREGRKLNEKEGSVVQGLDSSLKYRWKKDVKTFRGLQDPIGKGTRAQLSKLREGTDQLVDNPTFLGERGYMSTSTSKQRADQFMTGAVFNRAGKVAIASSDPEYRTLLEVSVPKESPVLMPGAIARKLITLQDREVMLKRDAVLRVVGVRASDELYAIRDNVTGNIRYIHNTDPLSTPDVVKEDPGAYWEGRAGRDVTKDEAQRLVESGQASFKGLPGVFRYDYERYRDLATDVDQLRLGGKKYRCTLRTVTVQATYLPQVDLADVEKSGHTALVDLRKTTSERAHQLLLVRWAESQMWLIRSAHEN